MNRMKKKAVLIALVISLSLAWISYALIKKRNAAVITGAQAAGIKSILVAAADIPERKPLTQELFVRNSIPAKLFQPSMVIDMETGVDYFARQPIAKGEILYRNRLGVSGEEPELSYMVDWDQGCVTLRVNDVAGISGILKPGDFVDVYVTYSKDQLNGLPMKDNPESFTKRIVSGCKVVATENEVLTPGAVQAENGRGAFAPKKRETDEVKRVTLAASYTEIEKLVHASTLGKIHLALMSDKDKRRKERPGFGTKDLYAELFNRDVHAVECIRGGKSELLYVDR